MNTDGTGFSTCKECHKPESLWNHTTTDNKEGEKLEDRRNVGESSCNCGDGTDQRVQSFMFMMMMMMITINVHRSSRKSTRYSCQISTKLQFRQIFLKYSNTKFHKNPFRSCYMRMDTDRQIKSLFAIQRRRWKTVGQDFFIRRHCKLLRLLPEYQHTDRRV